MASCIIDDTGFKKPRSRNFRYSYHPSKAPSSEKRSLNVESFHPLSKFAAHKTNWKFPRKNIGCTKVLENIASIISNEIFLVNSKSFTESLVHETRLQKAAALRRSLNVLKDVISEGIMKKLAGARINRPQMQHVYREENVICN